MQRTLFASLIAIALTLAASSAGGDPAAAQTGEVIRSFDATYVIAEDGTIAVTASPVAAAGSGLHSMVEVLR